MYRTAAGGACPNVTDLRKRSMLHKAHYRALTPEGDSVLFAS